MKGAQSLVFHNTIPPLLSAGSPPGSLTHALRPEVCKLRLFPRSWAAISNGNPANFEGNGKLSSTIFGA